MKSIERIILSIIEGIVAITAILVTIGLPLLVVFGIPILVFILLVKLILKI